MIKHLSYDKFTMRHKFSNIYKSNGIKSGIFKECRNLLFESKT